MSFEAIRAAVARFFLRRVPCDFILQDPPPYPLREGWSLWVCRHCKTRWIKPPESESQHQR